MGIDCTFSPGDAEANTRSDMQALKSSPYVRKEIPVIGYVLDVATGRLKEIKYVPPGFLSVSPSPVVVQNPVMPLVWHTASNFPSWPDG